MNEKLLFSVLGALVGAGVTYFVMKDKVNKEVAKEVEKYHKDIQAKTHKTPVKDPLMSPLDPSLAAHSSIDGGPVSLDNQRTNYAAMASNYKKSLDDIAPVPEPNPQPIEEEKVYPIRVITAEEFNLNPTEADITDLVWYPDTDELTDEYDEEIEERFRLVGNCLDELIGVQPLPTDEDGLIFVLNEDVNVIYAIAVVSGDRKGGAEEG